MTLCLALLLAFLHDPPRRVTLLEPSWGKGEISLNARLLVMAEVSPAESLDEVWLDLRPEGGTWEPRAIPASKQIRSPRGTLVAVTVEPREIAWLKAGDEFEIRVRSAYRDGESRSSTGVAVRLIDPHRRELDLLDRLSACDRRLGILGEGVDADYRRLSRLERASIEGPGFQPELEAIQDRWKERLREVLQASEDIRSLLEGAATDQFVDGVREARYRKIWTGLQSCGSGASVGNHLAGARRAIDREDRREALRAALDAEDQFVTTFQRAAAELKVWRERLELRREVRSLLQSQKGLNVELELRRHR